MKYPYDDEFMVYDYEEHRYILTPQAIIQKLGVDLAELNFGGIANVEMASQLFLDEISDFIYNQIYDYSSQPYIQEWQIAKYPSARNVIMKAMLKQVDYVRVNGFLHQYSGVDLKKNVANIKMSDKFLAPMAKSVLTKPLIESGVPLMYAGKYSMIFKPKYEEEEY